MSLKRVALVVLGVILLSDLVVAMNTPINVVLEKYKAWGIKQYRKEPQKDLNVRNYYTTLADTSYPLIKTIEDIKYDETYKNVNNAIQNIKDGIKVKFIFNKGDGSTGVTKQAEGKLYFQPEKESKLQYSSSQVDGDGYEWTEIEGDFETIHSVESTFTPLGAACLWGKFEIAASYLILGANPNNPVKLFAGSRVYLNKYPMHMTLDWYKIANQDKLKQAYLDLVGFLMLKGARLDMKDNLGKSVLDSAEEVLGDKLILAMVNGGKVDQIERLLKENVSLKVKDFNGFDALDVAVFRSGVKGYPTAKIITLLAQSKHAKQINPNETYEDETTNLHLLLSASKNKEADIKALLQYPGIDPNIQNKDGVAPIHLALRHPVNPEVLKMLVDFSYIRPRSGSIAKKTIRTDPNLVSFGGKGGAPLHVAIHEYHQNKKYPIEKVLEILMSHQFIDPSVKDSASQAVLELIITYARQDAVPEHFDSNKLIETIMNAANDKPDLKQKLYSQGAVWSAGVSDKTKGLVQLLETYKPNKEEAKSQAGILGTLQLTIDSLRAQLKKLYGEIGKLFPKTS